MVTNGSEENWVVFKDVDYIDQTQPDATLCKTVCSITAFSFITHSTTELSLNAYFLNIGFFLTLYTLCAKPPDIRVNTSHRSHIPNHSHAHTNTYFPRPNLSPCTPANSPETPREALCYTIIKTRRGDVSFNVNIDFSARAKNAKMQTAFAN